jgi:hypothetical protein
MMFKILSKLFGSTGGAVAEKIGGLVDKFVQTKDEKAQFEKEMEMIFQEHELSLEKEITNRHKADMVIHLRSSTSNSFRDQQSLVTS